MREGNVSVEILGTLPNPLDGMIREVLHRALDLRPQSFKVHISRSHADVVVHIREPIEKRLKFNCPLEAEIARELYVTLTAIVEEELGPVNAA